MVGTIAVIKRIETEELAFEWRIQRASLFERRLGWWEEVSPVVPFGGEEWFMYMKSTDPEYIKVLLVRGDTKPNDFYVSVDIGGRGGMLEKGNERKVSLGCDWSNHDNLCSKRELREQMSRLMPDDTLVVTCVIRTTPATDVEIGTLNSEAASCSYKSENSDAVEVSVCSAPTRVSPSCGAQDIDDRQFPLPSGKGTRHSLDEDLTFYRTDSNPEKAACKTLGQEIGKSATTEKSRRLLDADDWECGRCCNLNWARRERCNMCNATKCGEITENELRKEVFALKNQLEDYHQGRMHTLEELLHIVSRLEKEMYDYKVKVDKLQEDNQTALREKRKLEEKVESLFETKKSQESFSRNQDVVRKEGVVSAFERGKKSPVDDVKLKESNQTYFVSTTRDEDNVLTEVLPAKTYSLEDHHQVSSSTTQSPPGSAFQVKSTSTKNEPDGVNGTSNSEAVSGSSKHESHVFHWDANDFFPEKVSSEDSSWTSVGPSEYSFSFLSDDTLLDIEGNAVPPHNLLYGDGEDDGGIRASCSNWEESGRFENKNSHEDGQWKLFDPMAPTPFQMLFTLPAFLDRQNVAAASDSVKEPGNRNHAVDENSNPIGADKGGASNSRTESGSFSNKSTHEDGQKMFDPWGQSDEKRVSREEFQLPSLPLCTSPLFDPQEMCATDAVKKLLKCRHNKPQRVKPRMNGDLPRKNKENFVKEWLNRSGLTIRRSLSSTGAKSGGFNRKNSHRISVDLPPVSSPVPPSSDLLNINANDVYQISLLRDIITSNLSHLSGIWDDRDKKADADLLKTCISKPMPCKEKDAKKVPGSQPTVSIDNSVSGFVTIPSDTTSSTTLACDFSGEEIRPNFVLKCNGTDIPVNTYALSIRSEFFRDVWWKNSGGSAYINELKLPVLVSLLRYLYCGKLEGVTEDIVVNLYKVGHRYACGVRAACRDWVARNVNVDNFMTFLKVSISHDDQDLKVAVMAFMLENPGVLDTAAWSQYAKEHTGSAAQIVGALCHSFKQVPFRI